MKPRLPPAPWTPEDSDIILRGRRARWPTALRGLGLGQDIRDADLMMIYAGTGEVEIVWADRNGVFCEYAVHRFPR